MVRDAGFLTTAAFTDELMKYVITILLMTRAFDSQNNSSNSTHSKHLRLICKKTVQP